MVVISAFAGDFLLLLLSSDLRRLINCLSFGPEAREMGTDIDDDLADA